MTINQTGDNSIDSLLAGQSWLINPATASGTTVTTLTFSFMTSNVEGESGFQSMNGEQQQAVITALMTWADVANVKFVEVASGGDIQFGTADLGTGSSAVTDWHYSQGTGVYSHNYVYLNNDNNYLNSSASAFNLISTPGSYGPSVLIHEIGHALGLKHPGDYDGTPPPYLPASTDNRDYSVMSYNNGTATNDYYEQFSGNTYSVTPMLYDIQAMQYLYGANTAYNAGNTTYAFTSFSAPQAIWDGGGTNTFDFSACTGATLINLNAGQLSSTYVGSSGGANNVAIAYGVTIQNAIAGSGGSTIICNSAADTITGGAGNDTIILGSGTATIDGRGGTNVVEPDAALDAESLVGDSFVNIQTLDLNGLRVTMTRAEYKDFADFGTGGGQIIFADSGSITASPEIPIYFLADGANDFVITQPVNVNQGPYEVTGATTGSDVIDIRGAHIAGTLYLHQQGAQDTLALSGSVNDYLLTLQSSGMLNIQDTQAGRDGEVIVTNLSALDIQFTDATISAESPIASFVAEQNASRSSTGPAFFHYGIAGTTTNNVVGEESAALGSGYNAVILSGAKSQYGVSVDPSGTLTLADTVSGKSYTITGDHYLVFDNGAHASDGSFQDIDFILQGTDTQVAALYNAALGRLPDLAGLEYYAVPIAQGTLSPHQAAEDFLASPEFQSHFTAAAQPADDGGVNDRAFITQLYQNVLHRTPAASEINYYVADLQGTLPGQDRAQLLLDFATSPENQRDISGWLI